MAVATTVGKLPPKCVGPGLWLVVSLVAIDAAGFSLHPSPRSRRSGLLSEPTFATVDTLVQAILNELVALAARMRHVRGMKRGSSIRGVVHVVSTVTIRADGGHQ